MPRLPEELIVQIKQNVDLVQLIQSQGYPLKKNGKDYLLSCLWHDDKEASLVVSPDTNLWHFMGACQTGGSVIDWVMYYHQALKSVPETLEYLEKRGLNSPELINTFKHGYANRTLGYRLPAKNRKSGAEIRGKLQDIGIIRQSGHEHFNDSVVLPVMNEQQQISEVNGRKILGKRLRKGTAQHLYLPGPHEGVWNVQALKVYDEVILCEALIDAMTFWVHGFKNVTASYGTSGFTASHSGIYRERPNHAVYDHYRYRH